MSTFFAPERHATDRFVLRSYLPGHGAALSEAANSSYDHLRPWLAWAVPHQDEATSEGLVRTFRGNWLLNTDHVIGIWDLAEERLLGGTGFHLRGQPLEDHTAEIGMWIRASESGRGLGTSVLRAMLTWGFTAWPWERLTWYCDRDNVASARVAAKAGMVHEGTLHGDRAEVGEGRRTTLLYGLTRPQAGQRTP